MAPNKKKKKPAGNPARGFATTSIASKPKQEKTAAPKEEAAVPKQETAVSLEPVSQTPQSKPSRTEVEQTPEELEAQLERDELQLLVEKHASKARRESRRQALKIQTDRRVLRGQSESVTVHDWLSKDIMENIISLAQAESTDSNLRQGQHSLLKILSEDDAISKLWMLDLTLRDLGFSSSHIEPVLRWVCANAVNVDTPAGIWGLQEALEWLALGHCDDSSFSYEQPKTRRPVADTPDSSRPGMSAPF